MNITHIISSITVYVVPCLGVLAVDLLKSMSPTSMAFGVVGVAER